MQKVVFTILFILGLSVFTSAQNQCADLADCEAKLTETVQMLNKVLDVSKAKDSAIEALKEENLARQRKNDIDKGIIEAQDKLIELLQKQNRKRISFLFGLVKITF
jgi:septal ring factor EnvC (AmiA/AmiB activator)